MTDDLLTDDKLRRIREAAARLEGAEAQLLDAQARLPPLIRAVAEVRAELEEAV